MREMRSGCKYRRKTEEASLLISCSAAWFLTDHGLMTVTAPGPGIGDLCCTLQLHILFILYPMGRGRGSPEGPQTSTGPPVPGPHPELSPAGGGWGRSAGWGGPSPQNPVLPPRRLSPCLNQKEKWGQSLAGRAPKGSPERDATSKAHQPSYPGVHQPH